MPLTLPVGDPTPLVRSPLDLVVCQVRYDESLVVSDARVILKIHEALGGKAGEYERLENVRANAIQVSVMGSGGGMEAARSGAASGWRLLSPDGTWVATVMPEALSLETLAYARWQDFEGRLKALIHAVAEHVQPVFMQRIGLRYINRLTTPEVDAPDGWVGWVRNELLGPVLHPTLRDGVQGAVQQMTLDIGKGTKATMRHGIVDDPNVPGRQNYLLDFDVFREGPDSFNPETLIASATAFNDIALSLFQESVTAELYKLLLQEAGNSNGK